MYVMYHDLKFKVSAFKHKENGVIMLTLEGLAFDVNAEFVDIVA